MKLHLHRLKVNPEEARFAKAWQRSNDEGKPLAYLLDPTNRGDEGCL